MRRFRSFALPLALAIFGMVALHTMANDSSNLPAVQINTDNVAGKQIEDLTRKAVARDYAKAWRTLATALDENRADILDGDFVGVAEDKLTSAVGQQGKAGLHRRYVDHGHKVDVLFYSPDGTSMELRDTAQLEIQVLDGDKVIHTENVTQQYVSLMTPTEVRWKVRLLQEVPQ